MITTAFKSATVIIKLPPEIIPTKITLKNFVSLFQQAMVVRWMLNSSVVSISVTFGVVAISSFYGYLFAKKKIPW